MMYFHPRRKFVVLPTTHRCKPMLGCFRGGGVHSTSTYPVTFDNPYHLKPTILSILLLDLKSTKSHHS